MSLIPTNQKLLYVAEKNQEQNKNPKGVLCNKVTKCVKQLKESET